MPGYITIKSKFNPISLQDYLTVPTAIIGEYTKAEDKYEETANKAEALKALLGERNADNEAGWQIVDQYEKQLSNIADNIARGIQGPEAYRQARGASRYYRENMLPLEAGIPAYQKELERYESDPSMIGSRPVLGNYIKNPTYRGYMLSGDKIYADMVNQGKMAAADRNASDIKQAGVLGYLNHIQRVGYSPEEQQEYLRLAQAALRGDTAAAQILQNSDKYSQLYNGLNAYMQDHSFDRFDDASRFAALDRALSGQLFGMTGSSKDDLITDKAWEHNSRMAAARASRASSGRGYQVNAPKSWSEALQQLLTRRSNTFGSPSTKIGQFTHSDKVGAKRGSIINQTDGQTSIKNKKEVLTALHLDKIPNIKDTDFNYFIGDDGFKSLNEIRDRAKTIGFQVAQLTEGGGHGEKDPITGVRKYTEEDKKLLRENQILQTLIRNQTDYESVASQFNELGATQTISQYPINTGITNTSPLIPNQGSVTNLDRMSQLLQKANRTLSQDTNAQNLGLTQTGIGAIRYPLNDSSMKATIEKIIEGGAEIHEISRINVDNDGTIVPVEKKGKLSKTFNSGFGDNGALYRIPDADGFILYVPLKDGTVKNYWVPGTQIDDNYDANFNIARNSNGQPIKFSQVSDNANRALQDYNRAIEQYNQNPTRENEEIVEWAAQNAYMAYSVYRGYIENSGTRMLQTPIYSTAGVYNMNTDSSRKNIFGNNALDDIPDDSLIPYVEY